MNIWLNPKYSCNGCLVAKSRNRKVKRLEREFVHSSEWKWVALNR